MSHFSSTIILCFLFVKNITKWNRKLVNEFEFFMQNLNKTSNFASKTDRILAI